MRIFWQEPGVISTYGLWVCIHDCWMYTADTLEELVDVINAEWEQDQHLCM